MPPITTAKITSTGIVASVAATSSLRGTAAPSRAPSPGRVARRAPTVAMNITVASRPGISAAANIVTMFTSTMIA